MSKQREILCMTCDHVMHTMPMALPLYRAYDAEGNEHIATLTTRAKVREALLKDDIALGTWERVPNKDIIRQGTCPECETKLLANAEKVIEGGIYFECKECHKHGVLPKSEYTMAVRENAGPTYTTLNDEGQYQPLVGTFETCSQHTVTMQKPNDTQKH